MTGGAVLAGLVLVAVLAVAVGRPRGLPEAVGAVPGAALLVAVGVVPWHDAWAEMRSLLPVVGFLAAILVLSRLCEVEGLFAAAGEVLGRVSRGSPHRLLAGVFVLAAPVTAVLSLDATAVLLTPVVLATAAGLRMRPRPHVYACAHLANTASVLLPVSNLTNLLALRASGLGFAGFTARMALPWLAVIATEYLVLRRFFAADLRESRAPAVEAAHPRPAAGPVPRRGTVLLVVATLAGFVVAAVLGVPPVWAALAGCVVLAVGALRRRVTTAGDLARAANLPFVAFVLGLGVVVRGVVPALDGVAVHLLPHGTSWPALLAVAAVAAVAANLVNNLPAVLLLAPLAASVGGAPTVLAVLLGVNLGPNLTYVGSLATLLWRRIVTDHGHAPGVGEFTVVGAASVVATLVTGTAALWCSTLLLGGGT